MDKKRLEDYRSNKEEIRELQYKLNHLGDGDSMIGNSVILDGTTGYPRPQSIVGYDRAKHSRLYERYTKRIAQLQKECEEVELWIESIPDGLTRRIFRMYFVEGLTMQKIGNKVHMDKSNVSRKIDNYIKVATNATNATL